MAIRAVGVVLLLAAVICGIDVSLERFLIVSGPPVAEAAHARFEGFGAVTEGGAGQPECIVRSLADRGPGTLRECLASGRRYVKFAVAGEIVLDDWLFVGGPYVTIDGFSAPSPGITIRNWGLGIYRNIPGRPNAHDVIVRGLRFRHPGNMEGNRDCISITGQTFNIVIDHVSVATCGDGGIDIVQGPRNVTVQWSIISDDKAMLVGATSSALYVGTERISLHHNLFTSGVDRFPLIRPGGHKASDTTADIRYNVFRHWARANGTKIESGAWVNLVGNTYIPHPNTSRSQREDSVEIDGGTRVYTAGNRELGSAPAVNYNGYGNERNPLPAPGITPHDAGCVVAYAGVRPLDAVDRALLRDLEDDFECEGAGEPAPEPEPQPNPQPAQQPDLTPRSISAPSRVEPGQSMSVSVMIANTGSGAAPQTTARLYLSTDSAVSSNDVALASVSVPSLAAGASYNGTVTAVVPAGTAARDYRLVLRADDAGAVAESSESNNTTSIPITVASVSQPQQPQEPSPEPGRLPDLVVTGAGRPDSVTRGQSFTVEFTVRNQGDGASPASDVRVFLSRDSSYGSGDIDLGVRAAIPSLARGASHSVYKVPVTVPKSAATGSYYLLFYVDAPNKVQESNDGNNIRVRPVAVR